MSTDAVAGSLLVATPSLVDPNFAGTVILMLDVNDDGALGVVLNRPASVPVGAVLPPWRHVVSDPDVLFSGGPVETDGALAVALLASDAPLGEGGLDGVRVVVDRLCLLDLDAPPDAVEAHLTHLRVFAGYAGWGAAQLREEVAEGSWYVVPGAADDVFRGDLTDIADLRRDVLRRQPGDLAWAATRPVDPEQN